MQLSAPNDDVTALQARLAGQTGAAQLETQVKLAWHLRQRDARQALSYADQAQQMLDAATASPTGTAPEVAMRDGMQARLELVRGEVAWLNADLGLAEGHAKNAAMIFERLGDNAGQGDAERLFYYIWRDRGNGPRRDLSLERALGHYEAGQQGLSAASARARILEQSAFRDAQLTSTLLDSWFAPDQTHPDRVLPMLDSARALVAGHAGDMRQAATLFLQAREAAWRNGQILQTIVTGCNAAEAFGYLGELAQSQHWSDVSLALARQVGWPNALGFALLQQGNSLRLAGQLAQAKEALTQALQVMQKLSGSQSFALAMVNLGELSLDMNEPQAALNHLSQAEQRARSRKEPAMAQRCLRGQALALARLGQDERAQAAARAALEAAHALGNDAKDLDMLRILQQTS